MDVQSELSDALANWRNAERREAAYYIDTGRRLANETANEWLHLVRVLVDYTMGTSNIRDESHLKEYVEKHKSRMN